MQECLDNEQELEYNSSQSLIWIVESRSCQQMCVRDHGKHYQTLRTTGCIDRTQFSGIKESSVANLISHIFSNIVRGLILL